MWVPLYLHQMDSMESATNTNIQLTYGQECEACCLTATYFFNRFSHYAALATDAPVRHSLSSRWGVTMVWSVRGWLQNVEDQAGVLLQHGHKQLSQTLLANSFNHCLQQ